ncbi:MAG: hypothetical protein NBKEAIPA_01173 [Nitrospirae bacterium]|nr:MAG: hypothetical protein UZ03_NOB001002468 [Nitrospira sp. OLB3]MBV6469283.1 hypothetical protein [Nitrospirota bacterium]
MRGCSTCETYGNILQDHFFLQSAYNPQRRGG